MYEGKISVSSEFNLQGTLESGQTFLWSREGEEMFSENSYNGWYYTTATEGEHSGVIRVKQDDESVEWQASFSADSQIKKRLGLNDDLIEIFETAPDEGVVQDAYNMYNGLRIVREPHFPCLISFICSSQMSVSRIHEMQEQLTSKFGEEIEFNGRLYRSYPTPSEIASVSEKDLRDIKLGYRAPYVKKTAQIAVNNPPKTKIVDDFEQSRENLKDYMGVGNKVADCVLLYSFEKLQSVPIDTWIKSMIDEFFPQAKGDNYLKTSRNIRNIWGPYAGYFQLYVFHHLRNRYD